MTDYDSANHTTAVSGKHITGAVIRVNTAGAITIGKVSLNTIGQAPVYTQPETFHVTETGDGIEFLLDMDIGEYEMPAFQAASGTTIILRGKIYSLQTSPRFSIDAEPGIFIQIS